VAEQYATRFPEELAGKPLDRALLSCLIGQAERHLDELRARH
jgi:hypothetical protein